MSNWLKLHRNIIECDKFKDGDWLKIWVCLIAKATHTGFDVFFGKEKITLEPGQLITSRRSLSIITGVQESKIERVLKRLKNEQKIEQVSTSVSRLITVVNWERYQKSEQPIKQRVNSKRTANEHKQEGNEGKEDTIAPKKVREPNILWDAICSLWGFKPVTKSELSRIGKLSRDFKLKEATPELILLKGKAYKAKWPDVECSPEALLKHWDRLDINIKTNCSIDMGVATGEYYEPAK